MGREAKIGIALIGILLLVFGALLYKRMARPSKVQIGDIAGNTNQSADPFKRKLQQPAAPTLITPKTGSRPTDSRYTNSSQRSATNSDRYYVNGQPVEQPRKKDSDRYYVNGQPAEPSYLGDRYGQSWRSDTDKSTAQPYRSGYGSTGDDDPYSHDGSGRGSADARNRYNAGPVLGGAANRFMAGGGGNSDPYSSRSGGQPYSRGEEADPFRRVTPYQSSSTSIVAPDASAYRDGRSHGQSRSDARDAYYVNGRPKYAEPQYDYSQYDANSYSQKQTQAVEAPAIQLDGDKYTVQPNDSYWTVCERAYGSGAFFKALYHHNQKRRDGADELTVGQTISVPEENVLRRKYPDLCPRPNVRVAGSSQRFASASGRHRATGRTYTVVEGDTLFEIARYELGKAARWGEIYDLNRDVLGDDFDYLRPGLELVLPDDGRKKRETVTRQPEPIFPR